MVPVGSCGCWFMPCACLCAYTHGKVGREEGGGGFTTSPNVMHTHTHTHTYTVTRLILEKIDPARNDKRSYVYNQHVFHYVIEDGLVFLCMADQVSECRPVMMTMMLVVMYMMVMMLMMEMVMMMMVMMVMMVMMEMVMPGRRRWLGFERLTGAQAAG